MSIRPRDEFDRFLEQGGPRWPWVVIGVSVAYLVVRVAPWIWAGCPVVGN